MLCPLSASGPPLPTCSWPGWTWGCTSSSFHLFQLIRLGCARAALCPRRSAVSSPFTALRWGLDWAAQSWALDWTSGGHVLGGFPAHVGQLSQLGGARPLFTLPFSLSLWHFLGITLAPVRSLGGRLQGLRAALPNARAAQPWTVPVSSAGASSELGPQCLLQGLP